MNPSFSDMSQSYQALLESYNANSLLLNIVRASKNRPISFLAIPSITGSGSVNEGATAGANVFSNLPSSVFGLLSPGAGTNYGASVQASLSKTFTFTQSSMDNSEFTRMMLTPISLETIEYLSKGHVDKELLYSLAIGSINIEGPTRFAGFYDNYPDSKSYPAFQALLHHLIDLGLTTEVVITKSKVGPVMPDILLNAEIFRYLDAKERQKLELKEVQTPDGTKSHQLMQTQMEVRLCFSKESRVNDVTLEFDQAMLCNSVFRRTHSQRSKIKTNKSEGASIGFNIRSTRNLFDYLGAIVRKQLVEPDAIPSLKGMGQEVAIQTDAKFQNAIFVVQKNPSVTKALAKIHYEDDLYIVPAENHGYTSYVVDLVSQLMALNRIPGAIPTPPAIVIK